MGLAELLSGYILEIVKFVLANEIFFGKKQRYLFFLLGGGLSVLFWALLPTLTGQWLICRIMVLLAVFLSIRGRVRKKSYHWLKLYLFITICDGLIGAIWQQFWGNRSIWMERLLGSDFACNLLEILLMCFFVLLQEMVTKEQKEKLRHLFQRYAFLGVLIVVFVMLVMFTVLNTIAEFSVNDQTRGVPAIIQNMGFFGSAFLGLLWIYAREVNEKLNLEQQQQERYMEQQRRYYELLLKKEEDTRKYRHDMQLHFLHLRGLQNAGKYDQAGEYLEKLVDEMQTISRQVYVTGNDVIDILTSSCLSKLEGNITPRFCCQLNGPVAISDMDLCTIYGNLLENAVEELQRVQGDGKEKRLDIAITGGNFWLKLTIQNSMADTEEKTKKQDKKNHGLGLQNVQRTVQRLDGSYQVKKEKGIYEVSVELPTGKSAR